MKKFILPILVLSMAVACTDNGGTDAGTENTGSDTASNAGRHNGDTLKVPASVSPGSDTGDTSSYEKMPTKVHDTVPH